MRHYLRVISLVGAAWLSATGPAAAKCVLGQAAVLPLTVSGSRLYVPVSINGETGSFMVDTGAELTVLGGAFAARSGVGMDRHAGTITLSGVGGSETLALVQAHARRINVGEIAFQDWEFPVMPAADWAADPSKHDALLGMDFLHYFDLDIDLAAGTLTLWRLTGCSDIQPPWKGDYDAIPLTHTAGHTITLPVYLDDAFLDITLDTGADGAVITRDAAARAGVTNAILAKDVDAGISGIGGKARAVTHQFKLLLIGSGQFPAPKIDIDTGDRTGSDKDGLVDWRFLRAKKIWLSYTTSTLFVQKH